MININTKSKKLVATAFLLIFVMIVALIPINVLADNYVHCDVSIQHMQQEKLSIEELEATVLSISYFDCDNEMANSVEIRNIQDF